jgi:ABC-type antimicrobial peptide transport system permease subunit
MLTLTLSVLISVISAAYPAYRASELNIVESLRR